MQSTAATVDEYLATLPEDRRAVMTDLRKAIKESIPKGFQEVMGYGNICTSLRGQACYSAILAS